MWALSMRLTRLKVNYDKVFLVGFSVGATASWLCSEIEGVQGIVAYYGSRIRDYNEINPLCPMLLIFPIEEKSFNIDILMSTLNNEKIEMHKYNGRNGFSDPYSPSYNKKAAEEAFKEMIGFLRKH